MDSPLHILYIATESTPIDAVKSSLGADWEVTIAAAPDDSTDALSSESADCIVYDSDSGDGEGVDFYIQHDDVIDDTPFVLYTDTDSITYLQRAIRSGIDDVVTKDATIADGGVETADGNQAKSDSPGVNPAITEGGGEGETVAESITLLRYRIATLLLDQDIEIEEVVFSSIRSLLGAADDELDLKIDFALESLGEAIGATRCIVYNFNADAGDTGIYERVNEWCGTDSGCYDPDVSMIGGETIDASEYPGHETHATQFDYVCRDWTPASTLPIHTNTTEQGETKVGTFVSYPLVTNNFQLKGVIAVTTKYPRTWTEQVNRQIKSLGEVVLTTKQQRDNRIQLQDQNERLEQFTSVISHDLQNPLSIAQGYVDISRDEDDGGTPHLDEAAEALDRMEEMLNELLTLAKQGEAIGETVETDIATVVNNAWGNVDTKQAELVIDGLNSMPKQQADPSRLQEAIENLIKNAIDHVGDDVEITVTEMDSGFAVGDDGDGIPDDELDQIFDRGYTGGNGTGFGLAIVDEVVDAHGWEIEVGESEAGGAEFRIFTDTE